VSRALNVRRGRWNQPVADLSDGIGLLVLEGLLLRRVIVEGRSGAELLGPGDVVRPWSEAVDPTLRQATAWRALQITRLAVLDTPAVERIAEYPELLRILLERSVERSRRLAVNMAIVHRPRVDVRLQLLFWHLADRWGRVRNGRTILPLSLSHSVLADLIAAQRPTVTTALSDLASRGIVRPAPDGWVLLAPPPDDRRARSRRRWLSPAEGLRGAIGVRIRFSIRRIRGPARHGCAELRETPQLGLDDRFITPSCPPPTRGGVNQRPRHRIYRLDAHEFAFSFQRCSPILLVPRSRTSTDVRPLTQGLVRSAHYVCARTKRLAMQPGHGGRHLARLFLSPIISLSLRFPGARSGLASVNKAPLLVSW
jgi:CRP/FNR family transcriptional regulator, cyclic AMP receptor protein